MGFHTFNADQAERLEDGAARYRYLSREELLGALDIASTDTVADIGSGTGFYTDDVAPHAGFVYGVDVQEAMHDYYREKGVPSNVELMTAEASELPFPDDELDALFSTMTFHEFAEDEAIAELARILSPGSRVVIADWTATGTGQAGPPLDERFSGVDAEKSLSDYGFEITSLVERPETFLLTAQMV